MADDDTYAFIKEKNLNVPQKYYMSLQKHFFSPQKLYLQYKLSMKFFTTKSLHNATFYKKFY